jgi:hypothetical protein
VFNQGFTCPGLLFGVNTTRSVEYGALTRCGAPFQTLLLEPALIQRSGLLPVRSPLLRESRLISFPPGTEMVQFPGFASASYVFRCRYL